MIPPASLVLVDAPSEAARLLCEGPADLVFIGSFRESFLFALDGRPPAADEGSPVAGDPPASATGEPVSSKPDTSHETVPVASADSPWPPGEIDPAQGRDGDNGASHAAVESGPLAGSAPPRTCSTCSLPESEHVTAYGVRARGHLVSQETWQVRARLLEELIDLLVDVPGQVHSVLAGAKRRGAVEQLADLSVDQLETTIVQLGTLKSARGGRWRP